MITKKRIKGLVTFIKNNDPFYEKILVDFLNYDIKIKKIFRSIDDTKVILIETERGPFVLKVFVPQNKKNERIFKSFFKMDYYENLIKQTDRLRDEGLTFVNDYYLLAENKVFNYARTFIMLIEYIDGHDLELVDPIPDNVKNDIALSMEKLHAHDMVSGDPHRGNFMVTNDGIRIIDLSGKKASAQRKAKDRIDLERHFNIVNMNKDIGYRWWIWKKNFRLKVKAFKKKIGLSRKH